jgi:hypothetical protein
MSGVSLGDLPPVGHDQRDHRSGADHCGKDQVQ